MKRHFLMLAHKYEPFKHTIGSWYMSTKLDGMRCFYDGGVTRGMSLDKVPWANIEKDARYRVQPLSTGLWTRYGKSIQAPDWRLDKLPTTTTLDGELWMGTGTFQYLMSAAKQLVPGPEWHNIRYMIFDQPPPTVVFSNGEIKETNYKKVFANILYSGLQFTTNPVVTFQKFVEATNDQKFWNDTVMPLPQFRLDHREKEAREEIGEALKNVEDTGGEGLMIRHGKSWWVPQRSHMLLKYKTLQDAEGTVIGYTSGRETELGSKLLGLMGAMIIKNNGIVFELSGFTDHERRLEIAGDYIAARDWCEKNPGQRITADGINNPLFPIGSQVTYRFRELTNDGRPKEAKFWRKTS